MASKDGTMNKPKEENKPVSSEQRILEAARKVFTRKGYAATRTRDIAEEAGINLALLNYYYRSKEKLFQQVMTEKVQQLFGGIRPLIYDPSTSLIKKVELITKNYIEMISLNPDLPFFVLNEIRMHPSRFSEHFEHDNLIRDSHFFRQVKEARPDVDPFHLILNIFSLIIFPFIAQPLQLALLGSDERSFVLRMEERKKLIPVWVKALLET